VRAIKRYNTDISATLYMLGIAVLSEGYEKRVKILSGIHM